MIIKSQRVATAASRKRLADHLFRGHENSAIAILRGSERDLADLFHDARHHGARYSVRHWIVAPLEPASRQQVLRVIDLLAGEFRFAPSQAIVIEHEKERATSEAFNRHWHICVGEVNPATGKVMSSSHDRLRHEYIARLAEAELGHALQLGAHHRSVLARLRQEGRNTLADALNAAFPTARNESHGEAFTHSAQQMLKRSGIDLPAIRAAVKAAWNTTTDTAGLRDALREQGLLLAAGEKAGEWIVQTTDGRFVGSLRRLSGAKKTDITERMEADNGNTIEHGPVGRSDDPRRYAHAPPGCGNAESGSVVADDATGRPGEVHARHDDGRIVGDSGRHHEASRKRGSASYTASGGDAGPGPAGRAERSRLILQKLEELNSHLRAVAKRAAELAISPSSQQEGYLAAAERSARARIEQARRDVAGGNDALQSLNGQARQDQAQSDKNSRQIDDLNARLLQLEHRYRYVRFLPAWMKTGYAAEKKRLQSQLAELERNSALFQLRAGNSKRKLQMATAQESKRRAEALGRLTIETERSRSILSTISVARRLRAFPAFAWLPPAVLLGLASRLERSRSDGQEPSRGEPGLRFQAHL